MTAQIIQFRPRPNPKRDSEQLMQAMLDYWRIYFRAFGFDVQGPIDTEDKEPA